jgi:DNA recombination protein RmuC
LIGHFQRLGNALGTSVRAYNAAIGSLEHRVLPGARRFRELGAASGELDVLEPIDLAPRPALATGEEDPPE